MNAVQSSIGMSTIRGAWRWASWVLMTWVLIAFTTATSNSCWC